MPEWIVKYIGGGFLVIIGYIIVSNTLWLIFGSRLLQSLPGVKIKGNNGTLKIAVMLVMSLIGFCYWVIALPFAAVGIANRKTLPECMSGCIQYASKKIAKRTNHSNGTK